MIIIIAICIILLFVGFCYYKLKQINRRISDRIKGLKDLVFNRQTEIEKRDKEIAEEFRRLNKRKQENGKDTDKSRSFLDGVADSISSSLD